MTIKERAWKNWLKNTHNTTESLMDFTLEEVQKKLEEFEKKWRKEGWCLNHPDKSPAWKKLKEELK